MRDLQYFSQDLSHVQVLSLFTPKPLCCCHPLQAEEVLQNPASSLLHEFSEMSILLFC